MINCLIALHKPELAQRCLEQFAKSFPEEAESPLYKNLAKDIESDAEMIKKMETGNLIDQHFYLNETDNYYLFRKQVRFR